MSGTNLIQFLIQINLIAGIKAPVKIYFYIKIQ